MKTLKDIPGAGLNYKNHTFEELKVGPKHDLQHYQKLYTEDRLLKKFAQQCIKELDTPTDNFSWICQTEIQKFIKYFFNLEE